MVKVIAPQIIEYTVSVLCLLTLGSSTSSGDMYVDEGLL